jgi:anti-sigma B factor antagonist
VIYPRQSGCARTFDEYLLLVSSQALSFAVTRNGDSVRLAVTGEIDLGNRESFISAAIAALAESSSVLEIDLSGVTFCDSSGLSGFLAIHRIAENERKRMTLTSPHGQLQRTLEVAGLLDRLTGQDSR